MAMNNYTLRSWAGFLLLLNSQENSPFFGKILIKTTSMVVLEKRKKYKTLKECFSQLKINFLRKMLISQFVVEKHPH